LGARLGAGGFGGIDFVDGGTGVDGDFWLVTSGLRTPDANRTLGGGVAPAGRGGVTPAGRGGAGDRGIFGCGIVLETGPTPAIAGAARPEAKPGRGSDRSGATTVARRIVLGAARR